MKLFLFCLVVTSCSLINMFENSESRFLGKWLYWENTRRNDKPILQLKFNDNNSVEIKLVYLSNLLGSKSKHKNLKDSLIGILNFSAIRKKDGYDFLLKIGEDTCTASILYFGDKGCVRGSQLDIINISNNKFNIKNGSFSKL